MRCSDTASPCRRSATELGPAPRSVSPVLAAQRVTRELNAPYLTVMLESRYTDKYFADAGDDAPRFTDEELAVISSPLDFVGINVYRPSIYVVASEDGAGYREIPVNASRPKMASSWHLFDPEVAHWAPCLAQALWGVKSVFITENGCAAYDVVRGDSGVYDSDRVMFPRACLGQIQWATADGVPVGGYFLWSAQDNFEWTAATAIDSVSSTSTSKCSSGLPSSARFGFRGLPTQRRGLSLPGPKDVVGPTEYSQPPDVDWHQNHVGAGCEWSCLAPGALSSSRCRDPPGSLCRTDSPGLEPGRSAD